MSRKGNCWDNACMEHFFETLKIESGYDDLLKSGLLSYENKKTLMILFISLNFEFFRNSKFSNFFLHQ